ncbi:MAG TPA: hypothetical protein VKQ06_05335 [Gammaproteobacteria bacterium]|nr:hypothetical protein [Gammaproteobacteria bacterium]
MSITIVADRFADSLDHSGDRGVRHDPPVPDFLEDLLLGHQTVMILDEQAQQVECSRLHRPLTVAEPQIAPPGIEREILEQELHPLTVLDPHEIAKISPHKPQA